MADPTSSSNHTQFLDLTNGKGGEQQHQQQHRPYAAAQQQRGGGGGTSTTTRISYTLAPSPTAAGMGSSGSASGTHITAVGIPAPPPPPAVAAPQPVGEPEASPAVQDHVMPDSDDATDGGKLLLSSMGSSQQHPAQASPATTTAVRKAAPASSNTAADSASPTNAGAALGRLNPLTPGKVVEAGQEQTGRWTKEEHEAFLEALNMYGKEWKKVAAKVKTRTVVQTRTHAQKYFQKLQKSKGGKGEDDHRHHSGSIDMDLSTTSTASGGDAGSATKRPYSQRKKRVSGNAAIAGAASVAPKLNRRTSSATISAAQVISNLSHVGAASAVAGSSTSIGGAPLPPPPLGTFVVTGSSTSMMQQQQPRAHGFSTDQDVVPGTGYSNVQSSAASSSWVPGAVGTTAPLASGPTSMKIVAPDPMMTMGKGKFPEPSPAATGKRKLAEIAAARMLAGVIDANNNSKFSTARDEDGPPTPPLEGFAPQAAMTSGVSLKEAPLLPPLFATSVGDNNKNKSVGFGESRGGNANSKGLSLQILNPERLGVSNEKRRRGADGETSPVTPWDGQLEALVSEKAKTVFGADSEMTDAATTPTTPDSKPQKVKASSTSSKKGLPVCGPGTAFDRSPLHRAVCDMDIESLQAQLADAANQRAVSCQDKAGYYPLHTACALRLADPSHAVAANEMVRTLLAAGADATIVDRQGNTPLHWAARAGDRDVAETLLVKNCALDAKNDQGETPLHWGMRAGRNGFEVVVFLLDNGARPSCLNNDYRRPMDVAADGFLDDDESIAALRKRDGLNQGKKMSKELKKALKDRNQDIRDCRSNYLARSAHSRTLVLHHPECLEHHPKSEMDWEAPDRVLSIMRRVSPSDSTAAAGETTTNAAILPHEVTVSTEFERARLDLLSRVHSTEYLSFVQDLSKDLQKQLKENAVMKEDGDEVDEPAETPPHVVPFTPMVQRSMIKVKESDIKLGINSDTAFSAGSLKAARRAAGAVQHAVDCVLVGRNRNAFCVVRPPGHHAGVNGLLDGGESCGFCIFNNVAAGALYAISDDRLLCDRCAIVDIDVHHGNGTEEIVQKCHDPSKLFFFSIHLYDNEKKKRGSNTAQYKFYPGTGSEDDLAMNIINVPIVPLWKDPSPSAPSTNSRTHNTRLKTRSSASDLQDESPHTTPRGNGRSSDGGSETGSSVNNLSPIQQQGNSNNKGMSGRMAYRQAIQNRLLPALRAFNPDLILISAGFDASKGDVGNARHERGGREKMGLDLEPEDYAWTTNKILEIADICCQGRVVSVLEGGYGRTATPPPATAAAAAAAGDQLPTEASLDRTVFADCAVRHLHAMIDPYDVERRFTQLR